MCSAREFLKIFDSFPSLGLLANVDVFFYVGVYVFCKII